jgi:transcriptional regulator with XRE-family HTH domain
MHFSLKIVRAAERIGKNLKQVARELGVSYSTLRSWTDEQSSRTPGVMRAIELAKILRVDVVWLFSDADWPPAPYTDPPLSPITPWPPNGLSWQELQAAVWAFIYQRELDRFWANSGPRVKLMEGDRELRDVRPDRFLCMVDSPSAIQDAIHAIQLAAADQSNSKRSRK